MVLYQMALIYKYVLMKHLFPNGLNKSFDYYGSQESTKHVFIWFEPICFLHNMIYSDFWL